jgi:hypothetical protein
MVGRAPEKASRDGAMCDHTAEHEAKSYNLRYLEVDRSVVSI